MVHDGSIATSPHPGLCPERSSPSVAITKSPVRQRGMGGDGAAAGGRIRLRHDEHRTPAPLTGAWALTADRRMSVNRQAARERWSPKVGHRRLAPTLAERTARQGAGELVPRPGAMRGRSGRRPSRVRRRLGRVGRRPRREAPPENAGQQLRARPEPSGRSASTGPAGAAVARDDRTAHEGGTRRAMTGRGVRLPDAAWGGRMLRAAARRGVRRREAA